jgi:YD repeat-containing protein
MVRHYRGRACDGEPNREENRAERGTAAPPFLLLPPPFRSLQRTHHAQNELTVLGSANLTYDANGNLTTDETGKQRVWDAWDRLVKVKNSGGTTIQTYTVDALGRRIAENPGTARDFYYTADIQDSNNASPLSCSSGVVLRHGRMRRSFPLVRAKPVPARFGPLRIPSPPRFAG